MKKLINDPQNSLAESMRGFANAHSDKVVYIDDPVYFYRKGGAVEGKVGVICGGGSGHDPLGGGYVGVGMFDAFAPGQYFTSPTPDQLLEATKAANGGAGVLHMILNYTGDVLNFETAAELAELEDIEIATVIVNDDVAVENSTFTAGRRGIAGAIVAGHIAGAATEQGYNLAEVQTVAQKAIDSMASMGVALTPCTLPTAGKPSFELADDEMEIGLGVHGEPGVKRTKVMPADDVVDILFDKIQADLKLEAGENALLYINGLGGTPVSELYILYNRAWDRLAEIGVNVTRSLVGNYFTSLEMQGASLTIMRLDDEMTKLYDAPINTAGWRAGM